MDEVKPWAEVSLRSLVTAARERLQQGWCQKVHTRDAAGRKVDSYDRAARRCLGAALAEVTLQIPERYAPLKQLVACKILAESQLGFPTGRPPSLGRIIVTWNDAPGRTQAEVLALLDNLLDEL